MFRLHDIDLVEFWIMISSQILEKMILLRQKDTNVIIVNT
jgi:hypothetical protein